MTSQKHGEVWLKVAAEMMASSREAEKLAGMQAALGNFAIRMAAAYQEADDDLAPD